MAEQITNAEITKAAHNLQRLAEFVGVRRQWTLTEAGHTPAADARKAGRAISQVISRISGRTISAPTGVKQPPVLEPPSEIPVDRLLKFARYLDQLCQWFEARSNSQLPSGADGAARSIQRSIVATDQALRLLLEEKASESDPDPEFDTFDEPAPLTSPNLGEVIEVDRDARLILDHTIEKSLLQPHGNIMELAPHTVERLDTFLAEHGLEFNSHEKRRLFEKVQRWIESLPNQRVLVLRLSGLSGKPEIVASFQPKEEDDAPSVSPKALVDAADNDTDADDIATPDEGPEIAPPSIAPPEAGEPEVDPVEDVFRLNDD